ncbi:MAG: PepSY domain-containing protein [Parahaliea sp.]
MKARRWLYLTHRWLGIVLCLLVAMWFFSGVVMIYVGFPELSRQERLGALPPLDPETLRVGPGALLSQTAPGGVGELRLSPVLGRPAWLLRDGAGAWRGLFADSGEVFGRFGPGEALLAAGLYASAAGIPAATGRLEYRGLLDMDQWSVSGSLHPHRPLHRVALGDPGHTEVYVSSVTGEVVRDTSAMERRWNWLGANLHWIYPVQLRRHPTVWHWVIVVLSLAGLFSILTGTVIGLLRLRLRRRYRGTDASPSRGTMKLHHILGLVFILPLSTYMLSGLLSMNPWGVFSDQIPFGRQLSAYRGRAGASDAPAIDIDMASLRPALAVIPGTREVMWQWLGEKSYPYAVTGDGRRQLLAFPGGQARLRKTALDQLREVMPGQAILAVERLDDYDSYYYSHHQRWRPLPVLRVRFGDPAGSWFHIDLSTGELINRLTARGRAERWLYHGLHSLDFRFLLDRRPLWDAVVIVLCAAGFVFSITAIIVSWRRLRPGHRRTMTRKHWRAIPPSDKRLNPGRQA